MSKSEVTLLSGLADQYRDKCKVNPRQNWDDLLKAHTLYNACSHRSAGPAENWRKAAFDLQQMYWEGRVSTTMGQQQKLCKELKAELEFIRNSSRTNVTKATRVINAWNCNTERLDCVYNKENNKTFCEMIKQQTITTNTRMKVFTGKIIQHCVDIMTNDRPPCKFTAVALGSMAKGEATPYSDLEFMFLVEQKTDDILEYFELLAMSIYFVIGNLQETKLKYMNIKELKEFKDNGMNGFKIDGLQAKAGNIPTGNGTIEQKNKFILTVDELVEKYRLVLDNPHPKESLKGDFTAMLAHTASLYGETTLLKQFECQQIKLPVNEARKEINLKMMQQDIKDYDFLPQIQLLVAFYRANLKSAIYRFPSILTYNLKIFYNIESSTSWQTLDMLLHKGLLSRAFHSCLYLLLASALYIRTAAYLYHDSQNEDMTFLKALPNTVAGGACTSLWHMPEPLVLHMSLHMIPVKQYLMKSGLDNVLGSLQNEIMYDNRRAAASINFYSENYGEVIEIFENLEFKTLADYVRLAHSYLFFRQWEKFQNTVKLIIAELGIMENADEFNRTALIYWKYKSATGYAQQSSTAEAKRGFDDLLDKLPHNFIFIEEVYLHAGMFYGRLMHNLEKAEEYFDKSWRAHMKKAPLIDKYIRNGSKCFKAAFYQNKGSVLSDAKQYQRAENLLIKSLEINQELYGKNSAVSGAGLLYHALGNVYYGLGQPQKALEYQTKAQQYFKSSPSNNVDQIHISQALASEEQGNYLDCEKYYRMALASAENSFPSNDPRIADLHRRIACALMFQQKWTVAKKHLDTALATYNAIANHEYLQAEMARCHSDIAQLHIYKGEYDGATRHLNKGLQFKINMNDKAHRDTVYECNLRLAEIYEQSGKYPSAIKCYKFALHILPALTEFSTTKIAGTHLALGKLYSKSWTKRCISSGTMLNPTEFLSPSHDEYVRAFRLVIRDITPDVRLSLLIAAEMFINFKLWGGVTGVLKPQKV